jgi:hypothetical protein
MALYSYIHRRRAAAVAALSLVSLGLTTVNLVGGSRTNRANATSAVEMGSVASIVAGINKSGAAGGPRFETTVFGMQQDRLPVPTVDAIVAFGDEKPDPVVTGPTPMTITWQDHTAYAKVADVGALYGIAHGEGNPEAPTAVGQGPHSFYGAYLKSQTRFGPLGPGGIYLRTGDTVTPYVTIPNAGGDASPLGGIHLATGTDLMTEVGKASLGDLELDADEHLLYVTNLADRRVYAVDTWANTVLGALPASPNGCAVAADQRPFGLKVKGSTLYLGTVCSAESTQKPADLGADVWAYDITAKAWKPTPVMHAMAKPGVAGAAATFGGFTPWNADISGAAEVNRAPMLTSLDITEDATLVLGIRSRVGDMALAHTGGNQINGSGAVTKVSANADGTWPSFLDSDPSVANIDANPAQPPLFPSRNFDGGSGAQGAVVAIPMTHAGLAGASEVATTQRDLFSWNAQGVLWFDTKAAGPATITGGEEANRRGMFAKASGLGDLEVLAAWRVFGDQVWLDANGDGHHDAGEAGLGGVVLHLRATCAGDDLAKVTTDATGHYAFYVKPYTTYAVVADEAQFANGAVLAGRSLSPVVGDLAVDGSRMDPSTKCMAIAKAGRDDVNHSYDVGVHPTAVVLAETVEQPPPLLHRYAVGDRAWFDVNHNGLQDRGEGPLAGVSVALFVEGGTEPLSVTTTNSDGFYGFDNLPKATYFLTFTPPAGYRPTTPAAPGTSYLDDSDANAQGVTAGFLLDEPEDATHMTPGVPAGGVGSYTNTTIDAGFYVPLALGDRVWSDGNGNGVQDDGEPGVAGVTVTLTTPAGAAVNTAHGAAVAAVVSGADGHYVFDDLLAGTYVVTFSNLPSGVEFAPSQAPAATSATDSNPDATTGKATVVLPAFGGALVPVTPADGVSVATRIDTTVDAGLASSGYSIGNRVWFDENNNGQADAAEPGFADVTVGLYAADDNGAAVGAALAAQRTDADGFYRFDALAAGRYVVKVEAVNFASGAHLDGFMSSKVDETTPDNDVDGNDDGLGELGGPAPVSSGVITLGPGDVEPRATDATVLSASGLGARDGRANMTIDFGFTATVDLGVTKSLVSKELGQGSIIKWRITVANNSIIPIGQAKVTDTIATSVRPISAAGNGWACTFVGHDLTCVHEGSIAPGADASFDVSGEVLIQNGEIVNAAHVSNPRGPDAYPGNDTDQVTAIVITAVLPHTGSGIWRPIAIIADLLSTLGAVMVIHDTYTRRRKALSLAF